MKYAAFVLLLVAACATPAPVCPALPVDPAAQKRLEAEEARNAELQRRIDLLIVKVDELDKKMANVAKPPSRPHPDATAVYAVDIAGDPFIGPADALVTIIKAQDYACPFCYRVEATLQQLVADYKGKVRVVYKDYIVHPLTATVPAHAACAAHAQGRFADFNRDLWSRAFGKDTSEAMMITLATDLKLDLVRFKADLSGEACQQAVAADYSALAAVGVSGTPAFFINGRHLSGARPTEQFKLLIDEELAKASARIGKDGVTASNYYEKVVLATGKRTL